MRHIIAAILVVTAGCGLVMTRGPDANRPPDRRPVCTESMAAPKRDGYGAVLGFVTILVGVLFVKTDDDEVGAPLIVGGAVVMAGSYASGGIGYFRVKKCRAAIRDFEQRNPAGQPYSPQPYSPQPYPPQPYPPQPYPPPSS